MEKPFLLMLPGPTMIPEEVLEAGRRQMISHRGKAFAEMFRRVQEGLRTFFGTQQEVFLLSTSGTGAMEAAVVNVLSPGDRVLAVEIGVFGKRFGKIAAAFGAEVDRISFDYGEAADPERVGVQVREGGPYRAVLMTFNETSTGVTNDLPALCRAIRAAQEDVLILVDGISAVGALPTEMDAWGIDVLVSGAQKAWMSPPGAAFIALSERAWAAAETARMPRFYLDLRTYRTYAQRGQTPYTPPISVVYALDVALARMQAEGREAIFARHAELGAYTRQQVRELGLSILAKDPARASNTVTAIRMPEGVDAEAVRARVLAEENVALAGGQQDLKGKIVRIGHMGAVEKAHIDRALAALKAALEAEAKA